MLRIGSESDQLHPQEIKDLISKLLDTRIEISSLHRAYQYERMTEIDTVEYLASQSLAGKSVSLPEMAVNTIELHTLYASASFLLDYTTAIVKSCEDLDSDLPNWRRTHDIRGWGNRLNREPYPAGMLGFLAPAGDHIVETYFRLIAEQRLAATAMAIRWYAIDHNNTFPDELSVLVPKYLSSLLMDPMADGRPLGYENGRHGVPRIWSAWENNKDDGGQDTVPEKGGFWNSQHTDRVVYLILRPRAATTNAPP
jgi:hypothetical protein